MSASRKPSHQVCFRCKASKGNRDIAFVYTDVSQAAAWRHVVPPAAWVDPPAMSALDSFSSKLVSLDLLHILHLGVMRDLVGSAMKLMTRNRNYFHGRTISLRLGQLTAALKAWCKDNAVPLSLRKIHKKTLLWSGDRCPELRSKAADALACLRFVSCRLQEQRPAQYPGLVACVWALETMVGCLAHASLFLNEVERETAYETGQLFIKSYLGLAREALEAGELYFKTRPKFHFLVHIVEDMQRPAGNCVRNIFFDATFADEDFVKQIMVCKRRMSHRTASLNILKRWSIVNKSTLDALPLAS